MDIKHRLYVLLSCGLFFICCIGCTHNTSAEYPEYVNKFEGDTPLPSEAGEYSKIGENANYYIDEATRNHSYSFRSFNAGILNSWTVQFGPMLEAHLQSEDVQSSFDELKQTNRQEPGQDIHLIFHLENYEFSDMNSHVKLRITAYNSGNKILKKGYQADGQAQGGKVVFGGAFAMQNAVHQSTLFAINEILYEFLQDLKKKV